ncbi:hypothetical protein QR680_009385 [Steinernema hermaphroditum]|uniref:MULE transposase domain-containing protein n=1 Tax=Steinernema hermaphroditum TaxID=289476 RepID=A0AA39IM48_9BILA|nr:hypothetical protein QR680_009385 [Steinernema hermaphroditum]
MSKLVRSTRGGEKLHYRGFVYTKHRISDEGITFWRCERFQGPTFCRGRARSSGSDVTETQQHCHPPAPQVCEAKEVAALIKETALNTTEGSRNVVDACLVGASNEAIVRLPKFGNLQRGVKRVRDAAEHHGDIPHRLRDINLPGIETQTENPENFLMAEGNAGDPNRMIILCCRTDLNRLAECNTWFADGTFKVAPEMFMQLWVIHGLVHNRVLPFVYCFMPNKLEESYDRILRTLINASPAISSNVRNVYIDFEKAEENAFRACIPRAHIHGCFFHFGQAIWRKLQNLQLASRYLAETHYNHRISMFIALAFCDASDVRQRFDILSNDFLSSYGDSQEHRSFLEYMETTWIGRTLRIPLFPPEMRNCKDVTEQNLPRTNNSVESWHNAFEQALGSQHPNIFKVIEALKLEQVRVNGLYVHLMAGEEVPLYQRKEYRNANQRLLAVIQRYNTTPALDYLDNCAHYVAQ